MLLTERGAVVFKVTLCFFFLLLVCTGCNNNDDKLSNEDNFIVPDFPDDVYTYKKDNDLVGVWELIHDSTDSKNVNYFIADTMYYNQLYYIINNDNEFDYRDFDYYRIEGDTLWIIATERTAGDSYGIITHDVLPDTLITRYHLSAGKDTLYFEKIDHSKSRYLPNCVYVGYAERWGSGWQIHFKED
jgi:hypothetical protein